jgi:hypothetical protein
MPPRSCAGLCATITTSPTRGCGALKKQEQLPTLCLIWSKYTGDWVVYDTGDIYCPVHGLCNYDDYNELTGGVLTHYLGFTKAT